jgi:outer membrane lipoprotein carrier protein
VPGVRRLPVLILLLSAAVSALAEEPLPPELKGGEKLAALLQRVSEAQRELKTLEATFEQRKVSHLLAEPSVMTGRFYYKAPDHVRWEYSTPREMIVVISGGVALTYRPAEKRAERLEVGRMQRKVFRMMGAAEPLDKLKEYFSFTLRDPGEGAAYGLDLRPTASPLKKRLTEVSVSIDRATFLPVALSLQEPDGDSTAYAFSNVVRDPALDDGLFTLTLPPDVEVVNIKLHAGD